MHSSRMRNTRSSSHPGGSPPGTPWSRHPLDQAPPEQVPPGAGNPPDQASPWTRHPPPGAGTPLWTEFLTHTSENITLPQTSFAGGKNYGMVPTKIFLIGK